MTETKICSKCLESKPSDLFYLKLGKPRAICKECSKKQTIKNPNHRINNKKSYEKNKDKISEKVHMKYLNLKIDLENTINKLLEEIKKIKYEEPEDIEIDGEIFQTMNDVQFDRFVLEGQLKEKKLELFGLKNNLNRKSTQRYSDWIDFLQEKFNERQTYKAIRNNI